MKKLLYLFCFLLLTTGCNFNNSGNLALQSQCATQAEKTVAEWGKGLNLSGLTVSQQNHYNQKLNKCFVLIRAADKKTMEEVTENLMDGYENTHLAYFGPGNEPYGISGKSSATQKEYFDFVDERMESNRAAAQAAVAALQSQCETQAQKAVNAQFPNMAPTAGIPDTTHYNGKLNKCFVLVHRSVNEILLDVYENEAVTNCSVQNNVYAVNHQTATRKECHDFINEKMESDYASLIGE